MKIEMGESLFYSWLRHEKKCQFVQTNWKVSEEWELLHEDELEELREKIDEHYNKISFNDKPYEIFPKKSDTDQIIEQAECDVIGVSFRGEEKSIYAVDVAFHGGGLGYGSTKENVEKVLEKCARTAMCLYGYLDTKKATIIFASPKIFPVVMKELIPLVEDLQNFFKERGYEFDIKVIANEEFRELVLEPMVSISRAVKDTSELFIRSYQLYDMFYQNNDKPAIGEYVRSELKPLLIEKATEQEIELLQDQKYSKKTFKISYPVLTKEIAVKKHYYAEVFEIKGEKYRLCNEWTANHEYYVEKWIKNHK